VRASAIGTFSATWRSNRYLGRGVPDVVIARTQPACCHLEQVAEGYRFDERLPLQ
jgi:hypothetical protein